MHKTLYIILLILSTLTATAQTFTAKIEDVGGYYRLSYTVASSDAEAFTPPSLAAFEVLSGPSTSTSSSYTFVNGHASHTESTTYTYIVAPHKSGHITIAPASVRVNGRTLRSNSLSFQAQSGGGSGQSHQGGSTSHSAGSAPATESVQQAGSRVTQRDLFIDVTPSRTHVREQEAVMLTYRIHARVGVGLSGTSLTRKPDFKGLISQELPLPGNQIETTLEKRNGITYRTGTILQYVVFPQQSGRITIPSITFNTTVIQQDHQMDLADAFFNGGGMIGVDVQRTVPPLTLTVDKLPEPRPANFSGAVGTYTIKAEVLGSEIKTNDVATYRITLSGLGNTKLITAPTVVFPKDFDTFQPKTSESTKLTARGQNGALTFDYTFVPRNVGKYTIPATEFVYFDTESGSYRTLRTESIVLDVKKGIRSNADVDKQLALLKSDIKDLHPTTDAPALTWGSTSYIIATLLLLVLGTIALLTMAAYRSKHADTTRMKQRGAGKQASRRLKQAKRLLASPDSEAFYAEIEHALTGYISDKWNIGAADLSTEHIRTLFGESNLPTELTDRLIAALDACRFARYAPGAAGNREQMYHEALSLIEQIQNAKK